MKYEDHIQDDSKAPSPYDPTSQPECKCRMPSHQEEDCIRSSCPHRMSNGCRCWCDEQIVIHESAQRNCAEYGEDNCHPDCPYDSLKYRNFRTSYVMFERLDRIEELINTRCDTLTGSLTKTLFYLEEDIQRLRRDLQLTNREPASNYSSLNEAARERILPGLSSCQAQQPSEHPSQSPQGQKFSPGARPWNSRDQQGSANARDSLPQKRTVSYTAPPNKRCKSGNTPI